MDDYPWISGNYLGRKDGQLFFDLVPDPEDPWVKPEPLPQARLVEVLDEVCSRSDVGDRKLSPSLKWIQRFLVRDK